MPGQALLELTNEWLPLDFGLFRAEPGQPAQTDVGEGGGVSSAAQERQQADANTEQGMQEATGHEELIKGDASRCREYGHQCTPRGPLPGARLPMRRAGEALPVSWGGAWLSGWGDMDKS